MKTSARIKMLRLSNAMTQKQLGLKIKVSTLTVQCWENGSKKPSMDAVISLAKTFGVSADYLLGIDIKEKFDSSLVMSDQERSLISDYRMLDYHGKNLVRTVCSMEKRRTIKESDIDNPIQKPVRYIPKYITPSAAGISTPLEGDDFEMIVADNTVPDRADFAVKIQGDSMLPYISDDDIVYVERTNEIGIGDIGIFCVDGAMYCKQYYCDKENNVILVSANPEFKNTNVIIKSDGGSTITCYGKVIIDKRIPLPDYFVSV